MGKRVGGIQVFYFFFNDPMAFRVLKNTLLLGLYTLFWSFPAPIILALLFNELRNKRFKKIVQTVSYFPHFISVVIVAGMLKEFTARMACLTILSPFSAENRLCFFWSRIFPVHLHLFRYMARRRVRHDHLPCRIKRNRSNAL